MRRAGAASAGVLGAVRVVAADGSSLDLPSASQRRLLALLAVHSPRPVRSEFLAEALDLSPGALRTGVARLRATVGATGLATASTGYAWVGDVDAARFCSALAGASSNDLTARADGLQHALDLWSGPPLEEFAGEAWADGEIARLTEIHGGAVDDLADALIETRRAADAVALLAAQIACYPYRDRSRGLLIRALASAGRQADALRAFQDYRALLVEESGIDPSPQVVRIERRVATGWDGVESAAGAPSERAPAIAESVSIPLPSALARTGSFVGRAVELETLEHERALVATTGLRCVVLGGEPGIGKTTLLGVFARESVATGAATVVYGSCDETAVSLQPFQSVLGACIASAPVAILTAHVAHHGGELLRICPALAQRVATAPSPTATDDATGRFLAFEAAADLLRRIARTRPLVMIVDDLQWAEPTALALLRHLSRALADAAVLLVVSTRDPAGDGSEGVRLALADLDRQQSRRVALTGLDPHALLDLVSDSDDSRAPAPAQLVEALQSQTAGHPLYASQLLRHWGDVGFDAGAAVPPSLRDVVWSRVHALGEDAAEVLAAAAVLGNEFVEDVLIEMSPRAESVVLDALDTAARVGLLVDGDTLHPSRRFAHALVANALYADLGSSRRTRLHGAAARALQKSADDLPADVVVQIARHCALAGWPAEAQHWSTRAGDYALEHLAPAEATAHYRAALDFATALDRPVAERADLTVRLGDALHRSGAADAFATLEEGARLARQSGAHDPLVRAVFAADRGFMLLDQRAPEYLTMVESALAVTDPSEVPTYARLLALLAQSLWLTPDSRRRQEAALEALRLADSQQDSALLARIAPAVINGLWSPGRQELRAEVAARAVRAAESTGDPTLEFSARLCAYNVAVEGADAIAAARHAAKLRATIGRIAEPRFRWTAGLVDGFEVTMSGRLEEAEAVAAANLELGLQIGETDAFTFFAGEAFVIGTFAGRHAELLPLVEQAARDNPDVVPFKLAYGIACAAAGREDVARDMLLEGVTTRFEELPLDNVWTTAVLGYAVLAIELDDATAAEHLLPVIEPFASDVAFNGITSQGPVAAYAGKLASLLGRYDDAEQHLDAALAIATAFGWTYHRATTLFALAQNRFRRLGALDADSVAWLAEASQLCHEFGFRSWAPQVDALAATLLPA